MASRTQIRLDPELLARAREKAADLGVSLAEYMRRLVQRDLEQPRARSDLSGIFDLGDSGGSDVARSKDAYIAEAAIGEHATETAPRR